MTELEKRGDRTPAPPKWEYASAPESREIVTLEERYGLFTMNLQRRTSWRWRQPTANPYCVRHARMELD